MSPHVRLARQQVQEHRHAEQRGEHADRQLLRRDDGARQRIGQTSSAPPASVAAGSSRRWSLPPARRTRCGTMRPMKPMLPAVVTAAR
jgi:hypothetical protein